MINEGDLKKWYTGLYCVQTHSSSSALKEKLTTCFFLLSSKAQFGGGSCTLYRPLNLHKNLVILINEEDNIIQNTNPQRN